MRSVQLKMHQINFQPWLCPGLHWGSLPLPIPIPILGIFAASKSVLNFYGHLIPSSPWTSSNRTSRKYIQYSVSFHAKQIHTHRKFFLFPNIQVFRILWLFIWAFKFDKVGLSTVYLCSQMWKSIKIMQNNKLGESFRGLLIVRNICSNIKSNNLK